MSERASGVKLVPSPCSWCPEHLNLKPRMRPTIWLSDHVNLYSGSNRLLIVVDSKSYK